MHRALDHFGQCTGEAPKPGPRYRAEREAEDFGTSLIATAIRYVELSDASCAVAKIVGGRIQWALESGAYEGRIVRGRAADSWDSAAVVETAPIEGTDATLAWLAR